MHVINDRSLMRDNYAYSELPNGGWVGYPVETREQILASSPMVKRAMKHFWSLLDRRRARGHS